MQFGLSVCILNMNYALLKDFWQLQSYCGVIYSFISCNATFLSIDITRAVLLLSWLSSTGFEKSFELQKK